MPYRHLATFLLATLLFAATAVPARATGERDIEQTTPQEIVDAMATKGVRGVANIFTGWLEIPKQIYITNQENGWQRSQLSSALCCSSPLLRARLHRPAPGRRPRTSAPSSSRMATSNREAPTGRRKAGQASS